LSFDKVIADLGGAFTSGQVYVALSRCTSLNGLILKSKIDRNAIITDPDVIEFAKSETPSTLLVQELNSGKANFYYKKVREEIKLNNFSEAYENFIKAIRYRNDIETEEFKKFFIVTFTRFSSFKKSFFNLKVMLDNANDENNDLNNSIINLKDEINNQKNKLDEQNNAIKLLLEKIRQFEINSEIQTNEIKKLQTEKENDKKLNNQLHEKIRENEKTISELEVNAKFNLKEIERLKNLKWYQKLFGKK